MRLKLNLPHHLNCVRTVLRKFKLQHFSVKNPIILCSFRSQQKRTEKSHLFEVFRAVVRSVEWSGVSGVNSPGFVPGPPQRQRSQHCASCADVHYRVLVQWTPLFAIASESPQRHACSIYCLEIPYLIVSPRTFLTPRHLYQCLVFFC